MIAFSFILYFIKKIKTEEVDLSSQYPLSSFLPDFQKGINQTNVEDILDLARNGTIIENYFYYNFSNGTFETCSYLFRNIS